MTFRNEREFEDAIVAMLPSVGWIAMCWKIMMKISFCKIGLIFFLKTTEA